jgi:hypothetical protein
MAERGLAFMRINEKLDSTHNGNFLDLTELTIKFDPFLANHTNTVEAVDVRSLHTCLKEYVIMSTSLLLRK